jgi:hypothetical protein
MYKANINVENNSQTPGAEYEMGSMMTMHIDT